MTVGAVYLLGVLLTLTAGALVCVFFSRWPRVAGWMAVVVVAVALSFAIAMAFAVATAGVPAQASLMRLPFIASSLTLYADNLSALFVVAVLFVGLWAIVFSVEYMPKTEGERAGSFYPIPLLLLLGMCGVVTVSDLLFFLVAWEFMSLPAYLLVIFNHERPENLRAGLKYFILTHIGNFGMFIAVLLLYSHVHSFAFGDMRIALSDLAEQKPWLVHLVLGLFALAFATKAGLFPTGDWLPDAHPAAPSSGSALLSGVMIKMGAYGILRIFFWLLPVEGVPAAWLVGWGLVLATWGAVSIFLGSSAAIACNDSKRLLAYSSVSQSGYIFLGMGIALTVIRTLPAVAGLALVAALVHVLVDAVQKAALFLTAGSVLYRTGTRALDELGGLEDQMPATALTAVAGAISLAGLPLTGAFVSKWLLVQSALWSGHSQPVLLAYAIVALLGSVLAVGYGLKYVGAAFLGPRSKLVGQVEEGEVPASMGFAQMMLAACSFIIGLVPAMAIGPVLAALPDTLDTVAPQLFAEVSIGQLSPGAMVTGNSAYAPLWIAGLAVIAVLGAWVWSRSGRAPVRDVPGWACGEELAPDELRPRASGYYWAVVEFLGRVYPQVGLPRIELPDEPVPALDIDRWGFGRVAAWFRAAARAIGRWHSGLTQHYVVWQIVGLIVVVLIVLAVTR